uniref:ATPase AAA-type core domain-containing protein n=1 Tax=Rhizophora mucronata TaxID=61149 RepID=A0A2P2M9Y4_RHIMU
MLVFPSCTFPSDESSLLDHEVAYLSPILAFNLGLHVSCLKLLVHQGNETLLSLFESRFDDEKCKDAGEGSVINVGLEPFTQLPRFASHLRVSFIKIPECGTLGSLKGHSSIESEHRQEMIDLSLTRYFEVDRFITRGDIFNICIRWNCNSTFCIPCEQRTQNKSDEIIYFKVMAMEPSGEAILRVNHTQTALVLGGSVASALPPDPLIDGRKGFVPSQRETLKILASVLCPPLCPSALSSKFRVAVLLHGLEGCGKRTVVRYIAHCLGLHIVEFSCHIFMASSDKKASVALAQAFLTAQRYSPTILLLRHFDVFRNLGSQEGSQSDQVGLSSEVASVIRKFTEPDAADDDYFKENYNSDFLGKNTERIGGHQVLLVATAESTEGLPPTVRRCFSHEIGMGPLTEEQRVEILSQSLQSCSKLLSNTRLEDAVKDMVAQTSGFLPRDLCALVADAGASLISKNNVQAGSIGPGESDILIKGQTLHDNKSCTALSHIVRKEHLAEALDRSKKRNASALGTPKVPNVKWEDVGGLEDVKKSILDTVQVGFSLLAFTPCWFHTWNFL